LGALKSVSQGYVKNFENLWGENCSKILGRKLPLLASVASTGSALKYHTDDEILGDFFSVR
jgi:hypothetical protein